ncbi:MAG: hypothetical protein QGH66_05495, partial [Dehalococcoidia bacterium]|nr:hypothetical protein [Dehalococcoidia bacterium]
MPASLIRLPDFSRRDALSTTRDISTNTRIFRTVWNTDLHRSQNEGGALQALKKKKKEAFPARVEREE